MPVALTAPEPEPVAADIVAACAHRAGDALCSTAVTKARPACEGDWNGCLALAFEPVLKIALIVVAPLRGLADRNANHPPTIDMP